MENKIIEPNPYGPLVIEELLAFESKLGVSLPEDYRNYLIKYNGAKFENDVFLINEVEGESRIHHIGGVIQEPSYASLLVNYDVFNIDLKNKYLAIADDAFGNQIVLKLVEPNMGGIYFWDHEVPFNKVEKILIKVGNSFTEYINSLKRSETQEEFLKMIKKESPEHYEMLIAAMKERGKI